MAIMRNDGDGTFRPVRVSPRRKIIEYALNTDGGLKQARAESRMNVVTLIEGMREAVAGEEQPNAGYSVRFAIPPASVMHLLAALDEAIDVLVTKADGRDGLRILRADDTEDAPQEPA